MGHGTHRYNPITERVYTFKEQVVPEFHKGVLLRDKKVISILDEGRHRWNKAIGEEIKVVEMTVIKENTIGVVTKNGMFDRIITTGIHFVNEFDCEKIIEVGATIINENQKGIKINKGKFESLLDAGQYYENPVLEIKIITKDVTIIQEGHIGLKFVDGILKNNLNPGIYFENHLMNEKIVDVNMQIQTKELKEQTIMTKDTVSVQIHSVLVYQITDAHKAICTVENIDFAIRESIKVITQQVLSENSLDDCMIKKQTLSEMIKERVGNNCIEFGVKIIRVDIKDIFINDDHIKEALASSAIAKRMAESKLINAEAEVKSAELMRKAADQLGTGSAMQIRQLETMLTMSKQPGTKLHLVLNSDMMKVAEDQITKKIFKQNAIDENN